MKHIKYWFLSCLLVVACTSGPEHQEKVDALPDIYPDYIGVTIPVGIAPMCFNFSDESIEQMDVIVKGSKGGELHSIGEWADFDVDDWHALTRQNAGGDGTGRDYAADPVDPSAGHFQQVV